MKKVSIDPGCISCRTCENIAPEVFEVSITSQVKKEADITSNDEAIKKAVLACPVRVIKYE